MAEKPTVAFYWCASCGGCEEAIVDLAEKVLEVVKAVNIGFWPVALDFKKEAVEEKPDGFFTAAFINGGIRTSEQEEMARLLRKKSKLVWAYGSCAHLGGIPGLANLKSREGILQYVYMDSPSTQNPSRIYPQTEVVHNGLRLTLPAFYPQVMALNQVIEVDYYVPGCAPPADLTLQGIGALLKGELPPKGTVLSPNKSLCSTCSLNDTKPEKVLIRELKRIHHSKVDPQRCFLVQGLICMGPATRTGCGERCIKGGMPCRGCFGPLDNVLDQGLSMLSALASILDFSPQEGKELSRVLENLPDPAGYFYRFSLPSSLWGKAAEQER